MFAKREEIILRDGTEEEIASRHKSAEAFYHAKAHNKLKTPYGLEYSPHYLRTSRASGANVEAPGGDVAAVPATPPAPAKPPVPEKPAAPAAPPAQGGTMPGAGKVGRNEPCPCGSGKKYKRCHGETA